MKRIIRHIPSLLLGACFVASGWLKGVDLTARRWNCRSISACGVGAASWPTIPWHGRCVSVPGSCAWGCSCFGRVPQGGGLGTVAVMSAFTALTVWLAFSPMGLSVQDCGCFGEAFTLGHGATLLKNVLLWALAVWHLWVVRTESCHGLKGWRTAACCAVFSLAVPLYSAVWLPPVDFLPFGRGALCLPCRVSGCMTEGMKR